MKKLGIILMFVGALNFLSFMIVAEILGGDASNGKTVGEHYYLGSHGRYTEVSRSVFVYSRCHKRSLAVTHALAFAGGAVLAWQIKKKERTANEA